MSPARARRGRLVVVGGGILGTWHALEGVRQGYQVVQLERDLAPRGASVRNFGLLWVSGRRSGEELELALEARRRWGALSEAVPSAGVRPSGSLTLARTKGELAVLEAAATADDAAERGLSLCTPSEVSELAPALRGRLHGALRCRLDATVEPRSVLGAIRAHLEGSGSFRFLPGREVAEVVDHGVVDRAGQHHAGDLVVCCPGATSTGVLGAALAEAPLRRVRLQMLETAPLDEDLPLAVADGDSLRYYPAYADGPLELLGSQAPVAAAWRAQLLLVPRLGGRLTIGDTHTYDEPFPFDLDESPSRHLLGVAAAVLGAPPPPVERRWAGVYCETTEPDGIYLRRSLAPGVVAVTGAGGRGMTLAPAIAAATFA